MDIVNIIPNMIPKMRQQMYNKCVPSLDYLYAEIERTGDFLSVKELDLFLAKFGIYLKSQEITELINYTRDGDGSRINLIKFVYLFRRPVKKDVVVLLNKIFDRLSNSRPSMTFSDLINRLEIRQLPTAALFRNNLDSMKDYVLNGFKLILGEKNDIKREEFLEFHYNIYWVLPEELYDNFKRQLGKMWGIEESL